MAESTQKICYHCGDNYEPQVCRFDNTECPCHKRRAIQKRYVTVNKRKWESHNQLLLSTLAPQIRRAKVDENPLFTLRRLQSKLLMGVTVNLSILVKDDLGCQSEPTTAVLRTYSGGKILVLCSVKVDVTYCTKHQGYHSLYLDNRSHACWKKDQFHVFSTDCLIILQPLTRYWKAP